LGRRPFRRPFRPWAAAAEKAKQCDIIRRTIDVSLISSKIGGVNVC